MKIKLYRVPILESQNRVLDSLSTHIDSITGGYPTYPASGYLDCKAPIDPNLNLNVTVELDDKYAFRASLDFNYAVAIYTLPSSETYTYFYFIKDMERTANSGIRLYMKLDTLNTYATVWKSMLSPRTRIIRQHEDRFISGNHLTLGTLMRKIHEIPEGINPIQYVTARTEINQQDFDARWSLRFEVGDDLEAEGDSSASNTDSIHLVLLPQVSGATVTDYVMSDDFVVLTDSYPGKGIKTASNAAYSKPRQSEKVIKEIQCPYCPSSLKAGYIPLTTQKALSVSRFTGHVVASEVFFHNAEFMESMVSKVNVDNVLNLIISDVPAAKKSRHLKDPKLYNSEFCSFSYVYDSYEWTPLLEWAQKAMYGTLAQPTLYQIKYGIAYYQSMDFTGNLFFKFVLNDDESTLPGTNLSPDNYQGLMCCQRNNDHVLFYNKYFEYMQLGYNYDRKTAITSNVANWSGVVASLITTGIGIATQNPLVAAGGVVSTVGTFINAVKNTVDNENAIKRKQDEAARKGNQPNNIGDASLLYGYNKNKLWKVEKHPSPYVEEMLDDLFYYYGYAHNYYGKPNFTSRVYFNFVQCEADFAYYALPRPAMDDIAAKLSAGVTDFHWYGNEYNLLQTYENYESALLA